MLKKLIIYIFFTGFVCAAHAQESLIEAGLKGVGDTALKQTIEQGVKKVVQNTLYQAAAANAVKTAAEYPALTPGYYADYQASYSPYGALGIITEYDVTLSAFYKRVYNQLAKDLSSYDIVSDPIYDPVRREEYKSFVGEMQELNTKMATAVRGFLRGQRDLYAMEEINKLISALSPKITRFRKQFPAASAIKTMDNNLKYYSAAVMRMPFFEDVVTPAFAYRAQAFNLSPLISVPEADAAAIDDFALPHQLRLAVVHDEKDVFNFFRTARQNGFLPDAWQVDVFENTAAFMQVHQKTPYQLIISDRGLDNTFDKLVLTLRRNNDQTPVIAHTAGISYDTKILYDKGYSAVFPIMTDHPLELNLVFKKYFYYADKGVLPPVR